MPRQHERVYVYRNLHQDTWSLRARGRVIAHEDTVVLLNAEFRVGEKSRQRAVREKQRNVHAFVVGHAGRADIYPDPDTFRRGVRVRYKALPVMSVPVASSWVNAVFSG